MFKSVVICCCLGAVFGDPIAKITEIQSHWDGRIIGGEETTIEVAPYQVSISIGGSHYCGGSIIAAKWILTAGHCAKLPKSYYKVRAGSTYTKSGGSLHQVSLILQHENFTEDPLLSIPSNDVALFRLSEPLVMDSTRRIIKLFNEEPEVGTSAVVTGWGTIVFPGTVNPSQLQIVNVSIISGGECAFYYAGISQINDSQVCAMDPHGGKDACQGDSGGPLVLGDRLAGVVSWGVGCAILGRPGVYAKVAYYRDWIERSMRA